MNEEQITKILQTKFYQAKLIKIKENKVFFSYSKTMGSRNISNIQSFRSLATVQKWIKESEKEDHSKLSDEDIFKIKKAEITNSILQAEYSHWDDEFDEFDEDWQLYLQCRKELIEINKIKKRRYDLE